MAVLVLSGCSADAEAHVADRLESFGRWLGVSDAPTGVPVELHVLFDPTPGAPGDLAAATEMLDQNLLALAHRPGSVIHVWILGKEVASTVEVGSQVVTAPKRAGTKREASERRFVETARSYFVQALRPYYRSPAPRRSPIVEAFGKIAMTPTRPSVHRVIDAVTDGREFSAYGDWECKALPSVSAFTGSVKRHAVLPAGSLKGATVVFSQMRLDPVDGNRCAATLGRQRGIQGLWMAALKGAGADRVDFTPGAWVLGNETLGLSKAGS